MGTRPPPTAWMAWQRTLGGMLDHGTIVRERCPKCDTWEPVDVVDMFCFHGPDHSLVNEHHECDRCGGPTNFHASPGEGTPYRPLFV